MCSCWTFHCVHSFFISCVLHLLEYCVDTQRRELLSFLHVYFYWKTNERATHNCCAFEFKTRLKAFSIGPYFCFSLLLCLTCNACQHASKCTFEYTSSAPIFRWRNKKLERMMRCGEDGMFY